VFVQWLTLNLGKPANGLGWQLVLVGFICSGGLMVTWSAASYLAGVWQTLLIIMVLYWPVRLKPVRPVLKPSVEQEQLP